MHQNLFNFVVAWAWVIGMFVNPALYNGASPLLYTITVTPAIVFIVASYRSYMKEAVSYAEFALFIFLALVLPVAFFRVDSATAFSLSALVFMLVAIYSTKVTVSLRLLNGLFIASVLASIATYYAGINPYGFLPGQSEGGARLGLQWRVSLFPYAILNSWVLAIVVIGANHYLSSSRAKWLYILGGAYFLVFSASRTGLVVLASALLFMALAKVATFKPRVLYRAFLPAIMLGVIVALNMPAMLSGLAALDIPELNAFLFRSENAPTDEAQVTESAFRTIIWSAHWDLFLSNPLTGAGTFVFGEMFPDHEFMSGSESFFTGLMARTGIASLCFALFLFLAADKTAKDGNKLGYCFAILIMITSMTYGSYMAPYDFLFLLLFAGLNKPKPLET